PKVVEKWKGQLPDIAVQSSQMERRSVDAERETESLKKAEFMMDKIGQEFEGVISSVTKFGIFVQLPNTVEGLVHISKMAEDYFNYIESHMLLMGERTGVMYRIGQKVKIKVENSDPVTRAIDFSLVIDKDKTQSQSDQDLVKQIRSKIPKGKKRKPGQSDR
ncbi:MAG TPA: S1 RNA-binding domain-containing protein, partial [Trichococcus flocculiformis]|nr:S1 RNA-binding domain-containing protein [Trichococcus flocculiformis]